ncbi:RcnB family protein [Novilysobacter arseniciresistens]|uniref:RcnB family protein n=1 Tax=Novilysobacter arseniciresistens TaxID=1385522 RepID=UPI00068A5F92|nr:RcnB family protein [Lysobacter arseniciresistens]
MKRLLLAASLALLAVSPAALAGKGHGHGNGHGNGNGHDNGKHKGWKKHGFNRGEHIPVVYLERRYYIEDYRAHRLAPPPRGHRWVRTDDGKYVLIAVATGIIADILLHH